MSITEIQTLKHPDDYTLDAKDLAMALRIRYLEHLRETRPEFTLEHLQPEFDQIEELKDPFALDRLQVLGSVLEKMDAILDKEPV